MGVSSVTDDNFKYKNSAKNDMAGFVDSYGKYVFWTFFNISGVGGEDAESFTDERISETVDDILKSMDSDNDGLISYTEFKIIQKVNNV